MKNIDKIKKLIDLIDPNKKVFKKTNEYLTKQK